MSPAVVLVGPPGAGKSTVGPLLAARRGLAFRDTDADVEQVAGKTVADIFVENGEPEFRRLERAAVARAVAEFDGVLALGGGAVLDPDTRALLEAQQVVFLSVGLADAAARIGLNRDRPLLLGNPRSQLKRMLDERQSLYAGVATVSVATDGLSPDAVADGVDAALRALA